LEPLMQRYLLLLYRLAMLVAIIVALRGITRSQAEHPHPHPCCEGAPCAGKIGLEDARLLFPQAATVLKTDQPNGWCRVLDATENLLGYIASTSPAADHVVGYMGTTRLLIGLRPDRRISGLHVLQSADSVEFVKEVIDRGMLERWVGMTPDEAITAEVDTVSGATMTSTAIRNSVRLRLRLATASLPPHHPTMHSTGHPVWWREIATAALIIAATALCFATGRRIRRVRMIFLLVVIGWIGIVTGRFIAQTILFGWAQTALPWREQPALVLMLAATVLVPMISGRALYCTWLCPHGAAQDWVGRLSRISVSLPPKAARWLPRLPYAFLLVILGLAAWGMSPGTFDKFEPFAAYQALRILLVIPVILALASLAASAFVRRPWCRFACPTGALLRFLQRPGRGASFGAPELWGTLAAAGLWAVVLFGG
jgi:NosR/NirI family transcriptional regulator, nitrous oxide reductase regulator